MVKDECDKSLAESPRETALPHQQNAMTSSTASEGGVDACRTDQLCCHQANEVQLEHAQKWHSKSHRSTHLYAELGRAGVLLGHQVLCAGNEVNKGVLLMQVLAVLIPLPAHLSATTGMGNGKDEASVH